MTLACVNLAGCSSGPSWGSPHGSTAQSAGASTVRESLALCRAVVEGKTAIEKALAAAQSAANQRLMDARAWVEVGRQWVRQARFTSDSGFYLNVEACATEGLSVDPEFIPALELRSLVLMNNHRFDQARTLAEQILRVDPENVIALGALSDALLELGRYAEATVAAQRQMDAHPGMAASSRGSYLRWIRGDSTGAKALIRDALFDRNPADPEPAAWVLVEAANLYWQEADYGGADALFAEALKWVADQPAALIGRARVALINKDTERATGYLQKAHGVRASVESAWLLHDAAQLQGDALSAQRWLDEAIRQGQRGDKLNLSLFLTSKNLDPALALQLISEEQLARGGVYIDDAYAWALYRVGRISEAHAASAQALRLGTRDARLLYHAGAIEIADGDREHGRQHIVAALALNPHFDATGAMEARALLTGMAASVAVR